QAIEASLLLFDLTQLMIYKERVFYFIEKSKAAVLQEGMIESKATKFAKLPPNLIDDEKILKIDLTFYETQLQKELQKKGLKDSLKISSYVRELFDLKNQYDHFISELEKNYPSYYDLKYQTKTNTVQEIQNFLDDGSAMLEYFVGDSTLYVSVISKKCFDVIAIKKPVDFLKTVRDFSSSIVKVENENYISAANKLSEALISTVYDRIESIKKLVIIPHDALFKVPFEALFSETEKTSTQNFSELNYLIKNYDISYHYSAALFLGGQDEKSGAVSNRYISEKNFVGFAPVFPKDDVSGYTIATGKQSALFAKSNEILRSLSLNGKNYDELRHSEWEVNSIIDLLSQNNIEQINTAYFFSDAKEDSFKYNVKDYKIVHIATHSFMNEDQPDISGVVFAQPIDSSVSNDGILYSGETYNLYLSADLVVLSSCESGLGKLFRGEGMMALNRGFLYSGASNIIFSLWKIPDKHTSDLMVEFYKQMITGKSYSESLRQAKLKLIKDQRTSRPRSWAGFLLIGRD
ncbi:MAG: CHAT domain-containing protein, partial [Ignavibacteria bacterium]|nr:CHAT domain-containing protein [Ignavibacteria bacterium]